MGRVICGLVVLLASVLMSVAAAQGGKVDTESCGKAVEPAELKECVQALITRIDAYEGSAEAFFALLRQCLTEDSDRKKIECVARLAGPASKPKAIVAPEKPATEPPPALEPVKQTWRVTEEASKMDGSPSVFMTLLSDDEYLGSYGRLDRAVLYIRCVERTTAFYVTSSWFLGSDPVPVMYRIDQEKPVAGKWAVSTDSKAAGLWNGATAIPFIKSLLGKDTMLLRITPWREAHRELTFNVSGLADKMQPLRKACSW